MPGKLLKPGLVPLGRAFLVRGCGPERCSGGVRSGPQTSARKTILSRPEGDGFHGGGSSTNCGMTAEAGPLHVIRSQSSKGCRRSQDTGRSGPPLSSVPFVWAAPARSASRRERCYYFTICMAVQPSTGRIDGPARRPG